MSMKDEKAKHYVSIISTSVTIAYSAVTVINNVFYDSRLARRIGQICTSMGYFSRCMGQLAFIVSLQAIRTRSQFYSLHSLP